MPGPSSGGSDFGLILPNRRSCGCTGTVFASVLAVPDFRLMSLSVLFHALGFVGEPVVGGWAVLQLTDSPRGGDVSRYA